MIRLKRCDNCGKFNPKRLYGEERLCGETPCAHPKGFYKQRGWELGTDGKVGWWRLRFPIRIEWIGWWTMRFKK